jgi:hypothetical protein
MADKESTSTQSCAHTAHSYNCLMLQRDKNARCESCANKLRPEKLKGMLNVGKRSRSVEAVSV